MGEGIFPVIHSRNALLLLTKAQPFQRPRQQPQQLQQSSRCYRQQLSQQSNHACVAQLGVTPWLEYVGTDDNIADLPSRGEWRLLLTLGGSGSFRAAVVPPVSSFVGPLLPLLGRRVAPV